MPNQVSKASIDEEATSRTSSKPSWMSHWTKKKPDFPSTVIDSSIISNKNRLLDLNAKTNVTPTTLNLSDGFSTHGKGVIKDSEESLFGVSNDVKKQGHNLSLALALGRVETSTSPDLNFPSENILGSKKGDNSSRPVVVFERHFSNDNFTCFGKDSCKYQKYSSLLLHKTDMENDLSYEMNKNDGIRSENKNLHTFFGKNRSLNSPDLSKSRLSENVSVRNVKTMRICTMVDSVEDSPEGGYQKISQRAHHVLFTKEICSNLNANDIPPRPSGVKIQPLWTSTDSDEKDNTGNSSVFKAGSKNEVEVDIDSLHDNAHQSRNKPSGRTSSSLHKENPIDEISSLAAYNLTPEKSQTKKRLLEIPDINEELPEIQPQHSINSTHDDKPSTSRVHSLNTNKLFSNKNQTLTHSSDNSETPNPNNRWIKRLKRSTSDSIGAGTKIEEDNKTSSHEKFTMFFNRIMKSNRSSNKLKEKEYEENLESVVSKRENMGCGWIQRWCQKTRVVSEKNDSEPVVICEPRSLKFGQDELAKKQFPSIGALALMGKAMNGYRSCEFSKRGSVVVWNTKDF